MQGFEIERNPKMLINRIYPLGSGEGVNKVNIRSVNQGVPYLENKAAIDRYGLLESIWVEQRFSDPKALKENALRMLEEWTKPQVSWVVTAADLIKLTDQPLAIDRLRLGTVIMINTNEFGSVNLRIKKKVKRCLWCPQDIQLELGNLQETIHSTMTAFSRKQEISETYAQGATTLLNRSVQGELSKTQPVELNLYFDEDILYVNTAELTFKATAKGPSHSVTNIDLVVDGKNYPNYHCNNNG